MRALYNIWICAMMTLRLQTRKVMALATKETIQEIKRTVERCVGRKVILKTNKGRKKVLVREGVLEEVYPNVFIVRVDEGLQSERKVSFSYSDILTETVELSVSETMVRVQLS